MSQPIAMRCLLFVPGNRPERFEKAAASGVDRVCIDLEDAVAVSSKAEARKSAIEALADQPDGHPFGLRINAPDTAFGQADLAALAASKARPRFLMVPKFETRKQTDLVLQALGRDCPDLIVLIETTRGLLDLDYELDDTGSIAGVMFGGYDYSVDAGCQFAWEPLLYARSRLITVARAHGLDCIDVPWIDIKDEQGLVNETRAARALGFSAKAAIHPAQVGPIQDQFVPSENEIARAKTVIAAAEASGGEAVQVDGRLVDAPVIAAARRILALLSTRKGAHSA